MDSLEGCAKEILIEKCLFIEDLKEEETGPHADFWWKLVPAKGTAESLSQLELV